MIQYTVIIPQYNALLYIYFSPLEIYAKVWFCCKLSATFGYSTEREREKEWEKKRQAKHPFTYPDQVYITGYNCVNFKTDIFSFMRLLWFLLFKQNKGARYIGNFFVFFFFNEESDNQLVYIMEIMHWTMLWDY